MVRMMRPDRGSPITEPAAMASSSVPSSPGVRSSTRLMSGSRDAHDENATPDAPNTRKTPVRARVMTLRSRERIDT